MNIRIQPNRVRQTSQAILDLSRKLRSCRIEIDEVRRNLRHHSDLEPCRRELRKLTEQAELETMRAVKLANALQEIVRQYERTEESSGTVLEGERSRTRGGWFRAAPLPAAAVRDSINALLK